MKCQWNSHPLGGSQFFRWPRTLSARHKCPCSTADVWEHCLRAFPMTLLRGRVMIPRSNKSKQRHEDVKQFAYSQRAAEQRCQSPPDRDRPAPPGCREGTGHTHPARAPRGLEQAGPSHTGESQGFRHSGGSWTRAVMCTDNLATCIWMVFCFVVVVVVLPSHS